MVRSDLHESFLQGHRNKNLEDEDVKAELLEYIDSQPARILRGTNQSLPDLPMFLEDIIFYLRPQRQQEAHHGYFIGYDEDFKIIVNDQTHKKHLIVDYISLNSFQLHQNKKIREANESALLIEENNYYH